MKNKHKISVVVPVYNAEKFLNRCIDSLLAQEIDNFEIILCDDASSDNSRLIMEKYAREYPGIIKSLYMKTNSGGSSALNKAINEAEGKYIIQVDNDDYLQPFMIQKLYQAAIKEDVDIVDCDLLHVGQDGQIIKIEISNTQDQIGIVDDQIRRSLIINPGRRWTKLYKKSFLIENRIHFPDNIGYGDNYYMLLIALYAKKIEKVNEPLYCYYSNLNSTTRSYNNVGVYERLRSAITMLDEVKSRGIYITYREEIDYLFFKLYYLFSIYAFLKRFRPIDTEKLKEIRKYMKENFPAYRKNKYYKRETTIYDKIVCRMNDINPDLLAFSYCLWRKLANFKKRCLQR